MVPQKVSDCQKNCSKLQHSVLKFDRSNKFDLCYFGRVNLLLLKSIAAIKWASEDLWGNIYFAGYVYNIICMCVCVCV